MLTLTRLVQTCGACPSQWSGTTINDEDVYIRYRWGHLRVDVNGDTQFEVDHGDDMSGVMDEETMLSLTGITLTENVSRILEGE